MSTANSKVVPYFLPDEVQHYWGPTRIMSQFKLVRSERGNKSPGRDVPFLCTRLGREATVFQISQKVDLQNSEFENRSIEQLFTEDSVAVKVADNRATALASLIVGTCYGLSNESHFVNVVVQGKDDLERALRICLEKIKVFQISSIIFVPFEIELERWSQLNSLVEQLESLGATFIFPSGNSRFSSAITVGATDIDDRALANVADVDILAPGVKIASLDINSREPQVLTGHDIAAAFVTGISLLHLAHKKSGKLKDTLLQESGRLSEASGNPPVLWNPFQLFQPIWDSTQDAFLGVFSWEQDLNCVLGVLNVNPQHLDLSFVHTDLPPEISLKGNLLSGKFPKGSGTHCFHFVARVQHQESRSTKMFYVTVTDAPEIIDQKNYRHLNIVAKTFINHYGGSPSPPSFPPYHFYSSCLHPDTKVFLADNRVEIRIDQLKAGDLIINKDKAISEVTQIVKSPVGDRKLFFINEGLLVLTECHRVFTDKGTAAIRVENEIDIDGNPLVKLEIGMHLQALSGEWIKITSIEGRYTDVAEVFHFFTDDDKGYFANGVCCTTELFSSMIFKRTPYEKGEIFEKSFNSKGKIDGTI